MPEKSPESYAALTYLWVFGMAVFGGLISYLKKIKSGMKWKLTDFIIELATASFAGIVTFYLCQALDLSQVASAAMVGVAGHFSSKAITLFGEALERLITKWK
jgi:hypothetical protein